MSVAVPFTHFLPPLLEQEEGQIYFLLNKMFTPTPHAYKHAPYKAEWRHLLKLEKCAGSQMSYLHTIKTTYTFAYKSDVSWFGRVKDVVKYCMFTSVNAPVNLPQATLHGLLHMVYDRALYSWRHPNILKFFSLFLLRCHLVLLRPISHFTLT